LENVCKKYDRRYVLKGINLEVYPRDCLAVVGPSGCGKTTLLRIIAGLTTPTEGRCLYRNQAIRGTSRKRGYVFQEPRLFPWLTVLENVELGGPGGEGLLQAVGLGSIGQAYPYELSGGMAKRVALARALAASPELLLLDEPFANLDQDTKERAIGLVRDIWENGTTCIIVTHDLREVEGFTTGVLKLVGCPGRVEEELR
jgi:ABC-type nitrate/sulfonate/bicarbonate transport system ATPase subunit